MTATTEQYRLKLTNKKYTNNMWREGYEYPSDPEPDHEPDFFEQADYYYEQQNDK